MAEEGEGDGASPHGDGRKFSGSAAAAGAKGGQEALVGQRVEKPGEADDFGRSLDELP